MGEKSSLREVLGPISNRYGTDLVLFSGNASNTRIYELAKAAAEDGRELIVLYFSDCDPSGWGMPTDVARKLQAFKANQFPDLEFRLYRVALTPEQVRANNLPSSPIETKAKSATQIAAQAAKRRKWVQKFAVEQTEIDALATLNPGLLRRIAEDAIAPFYDATLNERVRDSVDEWIDAAQDAVDEAIDQDALDSAVADIDDLREQIETILDERVAPILATAEAVELPDLPEEPEPEVDTAAQPLPVINSEWEFGVQTQVLQDDRKEYEEAE
jgi:hypothetical protein